MSTKKLCKDCSSPIESKDIRIKYCNACRAVRREASAQRHVDNVKKRTRIVRDENIRRGSKKPIPNRFLVRGLITGSNRACSIIQNV